MPFFVRELIGLPLMCRLFYGDAVSVFFILAALVSAVPAWEVIVAIGWYGLCFWEWLDNRRRPSL